MGEKFSFRERRLPGGRGMFGVRGEVAAVGKVNFCDRLMEMVAAEKVRAALVADLIFVFFVAAVTEAKKFFSSF